MAGTGGGAGQGSLENKITCVKYTLFCLNVTTWILGAAMFGLSLWLRFEPGIQDWFDKLDLQDFYIGIYLLIIVAVVVMIVSFVGCCGALMETRVTLIAFAILQGLSFLIGIAGCAVLLDHSTYNSSFQPTIRNSLRNLISQSQHDYQGSALKLIQEGIGCCGADGPNDYLSMKKPLPSECRDSLTGNTYYYGCAEEITWFLEDRSGWVGGIGMALCFIHVINIVLTVIFIQALKKEEEENDIQK